MKSFVINGGKRLTGEIKIHGSKNSVLPILAASFLVNGKSDMAVGIRNNKVIEKDIMEAVQMKKQFDVEMYKVAQVLSI